MKDRTLGEKTKEIWIYDCFGKKGMTNEEIFEQLQEMQIHTARIVADCAEQKRLKNILKVVEIEDSIITLYRHLSSWTL